jgi:plasmid stability protein
MHEMKALTIRNVDEALARALERERRRRGASLNQTVLELLRRGLGVSSEDEAPNGLRALAGSWSKEDLRAFESATAVFEQVDEELWE